MAAVEREPKAHITTADHEENGEQEKPRGYVDAETAAYAGATSIEIDKETQKRLFWKINRRVLACMLGVGAHPVSIRSPNAVG